MSEPRYKPKEHPGWLGMFTTEEYPGALRNGTVIEKATFEQGDGTPIGAKGRVLGSMGHPEIGVGYFVEWEARPRMAVFAEARQIRAVNREELSP
jgi:hypothetical protein